MTGREGVGEGRGLFPPCFQVQIYVMMSCSSGSPDSLQSLDSQPQLAHLSSCQIRHDCIHHWPWQS